MLYTKFMWVFKDAPSRKTLAYLSEVLDENPRYIAKRARWWGESTESLDAHRCADPTWSYNRRWQYNAEFLTIACTYRGD